MHRPILLCLSWFWSFLAISLVLTCRDAAAAERPNIVLIMADDMGFSDLGCYGGEIHTPNIDRLAEQGLRFTQFYNNALCGPTRASLMTGLYSQQVGVTGWTGSLVERCATIPELLKKAGYATLVVGRLDMTTAGEWYNPEHAAKHLDRFFGSGGKPGHYGPGHYFKRVRTQGFFHNGERFDFPPGSTFDKTELYTDYAVTFIEEAADGEKPFFLYVAHTTPHWPLHAKEADIAKYRDLYKSTGWDELRAKRHERLKEAGLVDASWPLTPRDSRVPPWENAEHKAWQAERMAVYAAQVDSLDRSVGRVLEAIHRAGLEDDTLVLFLSDNGASDHTWKNPLDKPGKPWRLDGTPTQMGGDRPDIKPGGADTFCCYGPPWANVSNAPFRGYKAGCFEGGIATPLVVAWPGKIDHGGVAHQPGHIIDVMATCLDVAGVEYPKAFEGRELLPLEGKSLVPVFHGDARKEHESLCWNVAGSRAVRMGRWKLVAAKGKAWELYDLEKDRTEMNDLAGENPERFKRLAAAYTDWTERVGIHPPK